jgi:4,5-dihydroxyphthalate decarboxylase
MPPTTTVTAAFIESPRTRALLSGAVAVAGLDWQVAAVSPGDLFARQLKSAEFDVSELSMSSYAIALAQGNDTWTALPVFTSREFFHTGIIVREDSPLHDPRELRGKRVGVLEYQQTSVVWIRGILQHHYGIDPRELEWYMERRPEKSHGGSTGFVPPNGIRLQYVDEASSLAALLMDGTIDAILFYPQLNDAIDRKPGDHRTALRARTLLADPAAEGLRYRAATGIVPINHGVVIRRTLLRERPGLAAEVYRALVASRDAAGDRDGFPYGIASNRVALDTLTQYLDEQHLTARRLSLDELFAPGSEWQ